MTAKVLIFVFGRVVKGRFRKRAFVFPTRLLRQRAFSDNRLSAKGDVSVDCLTFFDLFNNFATAILRHGENCGFSPLPLWERAG